MTMVEAFYVERTKARATRPARRVVAASLRGAVRLGERSLMWAGAFVFRGSHDIT